MTSGVESLKISRVGSLPILLGCVRDIGGGVDATPNYDDVTTKITYSLRDRGWGGEGGGERDFVSE